VALAMQFFEQQSVQAGVDASSFGQSAKLSDMHATWIEKGAQEFVPGVGNVSSSPNAGSNPAVRTHANQQRAAQQRAMLRGDGGFGQMGPGMASGFGPNWGQAMNNFMGNAEGQWAMPQQMPASFPQMGDSAAGAMKAPIPPPPAPPKTYAAVWNLSTDYTSKVIKEMLEDVDFAPDTCAEVEEGSFLLTFSTSWLAGALSVSLDGSREVLKTQDEKLIRVATYGVESPKWSTEDVPQSVQRVLQQKLAS